MTGNINAGPDYGDEPPGACLSRVFLGHDSFACGETPGHAGNKHYYRLPWVTIEWDGRAERSATAAAQEPQPAPGSEAGQYVVFRKTGPGCYPTAHGPYTEAEADRLSEPRDDNESRLKLLLGCDLED